MQIKTTLRFHLTPVRITIIKYTTNNKCWWRCREKGTLKCCWWEYKLIQPRWKTIWRLLKKLNICLSYNPAIQIQLHSFRDVPKGMQLSLLQRHLHTHVYHSTIHNSQAMETAKMLHYQGMD
jgi:hypothetical protein